MTHGTPTGYAKHGCRCDQCRAAQRDRMRVYRARVLETSGPGATSSGTTEKRPGDAPTSRGMAHEEVPS